MSIVVKVLTMTFLTMGGDRTVRENFENFGNERTDFSVHDGEHSQNRTMERPGNGLKMSLISEKDERIEKQSCDSRADDIMRGGGFVSNKRT